MEPNSINQFPPQMPLPQKPETSYGAIIASVIVILVLVVGGLYFWGKKVSEQMRATTPTEETSTSTQSVDSSEAAIESDLDLDADMKTIDESLKNI